MTVGMYTRTENRDGRAAEGRSGTEGDGSGTGQQLTPRVAASRTNQSETAQCSTFSRIQGSAVEGKPFSCSSSTSLPVQCITIFLLRINLAARRNFPALTRPPI